ncbi:MAG: hypothetical protein L6Q33_03400 [Bacteriovoracaceae bacterium]|nr:hypothetical protein [Bacteriovoracaceae bacterium]
MAKTKNPLYVVKNNGVDVEVAISFFDLMLKKFNLEAIVPIFEAVVQAILSEVNSYPVFLEVKKMLDLFFEQFIGILFEIQQKLMAKKI